MGRQARSMLVYNRRGQGVLVHLSAMDTLKQFRHVVFLVTVILLTACQTVGEDLSATMAAGDAMLATEDARMIAESRRGAVEAAGTVAIGQTRIAELYSINDQLFATVSAGSTPTVALIVGQAPIDGSSDMVMEEGDRLFTQSGISMSVSSVDGCVVDPRGSFSQSELQQLYATAQVINASGSLNMRADWFYEGQLITQASWTMSPTTSPFCFWSVIDRNDTDFPPGNYTIQMYLDNIPLSDLTMSFVVSE